jgi:hypothetical protein
MAKKKSQYGSPSRYGQTDPANQAAFEREQEIRGLLDKVVSAYSPGGAFGAGTEAMLERQREQYLGSATQQLISSGLYGSTMAAGLGKKFEEEVGMPTRAKLEDIRMQAYTEALGQKAGFIERIEEERPSFETIAGLTQQAAAKPQESLSDWMARTFGGGGVTPSPTYDPTLSAGMSPEEIRRIKKEQAGKSYSVQMGTPIYGQTSRYA